MMMFLIVVESQCCLVATVFPNDDNGGRQRSTQKQDALLLFSSPSPSLTFGRVQSRPNALSLIKVESDVCLVTLNYLASW